MKAEIVAKAYSDAKEYYASKGIDTEEALAHLQQYDNPYLFTVPEVGQGRACDGMSKEDCIKVLLDVPGCNEQDVSRLCLCVKSTEDNRADSIITIITEARKAQKDHLLTLLKDGEMLDAVYNEFCVRNNVPVADEYISDVKNYI